MIGIPVGLVVANIAEWVFHRHIQHGVGQRLSTFWDFHVQEHHPVVLKNDFADDSYHRSLFQLPLHAQNREALSLAVAAAAVTPLLPIAPFFTLTLQYSAFNYYRVHKRAHLDPAWGKQHLPWHYAHHMVNPSANYCVTRPWFDHVMGTREK